MTDYRDDIGIRQTSFTIMSTQVDFPSTQLYGPEDSLHFCSNIAGLAFDNIVEKAKKEVLSQYAEGEELPLIVVVCAGWNAEPNKLRSIKEALCAKHLSFCKDTIDLQNWAYLHADEGKTGNIGDSLPKNLCQTNIEDDVQIRRINNQSLPRGYARYFYNDEN